MKETPNTPEALSAKNRDLPKIHSSFLGEERRPFSVTIYNKSVSEVFNVLQNVENFLQFCENLEKVETLDADNVKWYFRNHDPVFDYFTVDMKMSFDKTNNSIVWKSQDAAGFEYSVAIQLQQAAAMRGTIVHLSVSYDNLAGELVGKFESLFGKDAESTCKRNIHRFKAFCETGSVPTIEGQSSGREEDLQLKH